MSTIVSASLYRFTFYQCKIINAINKRENKKRKSIIKNVINVALSSFSSSVSCFFISLIEKIIK